LTPAELKAAGIALPRMAVPGDKPAHQQAIDQRPLPAAWSDVEILREKDFAEYTEAERELARRLILRLAHRRPTRQSRRLRYARARRSRSRRGDDARHSRGWRYVRRHAHRRGAGHAQSRAWPPNRARRRRRDPLGRLGPRRPGPARRGDGAPGPLRTSPGMA